MREETFRVNSFVQSSLTADGHEERFFINGILGMTGKDEREFYMQMIYV